MPLPEAYGQRKLLIQKDTCMPVFIAALLTVAETWKQLNAHRQRNGYGESVVYIYSATKKSDMPFAASVDGPRDDHTEGQTEKRQVPDVDAEIRHKRTWL